MAAMQPTPHGSITPRPLCNNTSSVLFFSYLPFCLFHCPWKTWKKRGKPWGKSPFPVYLPHAHQFSGKFPAKPSEKRCKQGFIPVKNLALFSIMYEL
jgi:hypothetical protein